jgi:hypothetical protein
VVQPGFGSRSSEKARSEHDVTKCGTHMLINMMPRDQTSAARGEYIGAQIFLHSVVIAKQRQ